MFALDQLARIHEHDLLEEAARERLARLSATARRRTQQRRTAGGAAAWRRVLGWAVMDIGAWLAGGSIESGCA